ncbi:hypothetical protein M422DRAFT_143487, partial [Sphaerobolus stellatus SS14]
VPSICYVNSALITVHAPTTLKPNNKIYLLAEDFIEDTFTKYMNNIEPTLFDDLEGVDPDIGQFLIFLQHLQWHITEGTIFLNDFQGGQEILTDCQCITKPSLGDTLFGLGNLTTAWYRFPLAHKCNFFCIAFKLSPPESQGTTSRISPDIE